jgi:hypothetical protein
LPAMRVFWGNNRPWPLIPTSHGQYRRRRELPLFHEHAVGKRRLTLAGLSKISRRGSNPNLLRNSRGLQKRGPDSDGSQLSRRLGEAISCALPSFGMLSSRHHRLNGSRSLRCAASVLPRGPHMQDRELHALSCQQSSVWRRTIQGEKRECRGPIMVRGADAPPRRGQGGRPIGAPRLLGLSATLSQAKTACAANRDHSRTAIPDLPFRYDRHAIPTLAPDQVNHRGIASSLPWR